VQQIEKAPDIFVSPPAKPETFSRNLENRIDLPDSTLAYKSDLTQESENIQNEKQRRLMESSSSEDENYVPMTVKVPEYPGARPKIRQNPEIRKSGDENYVPMTVKVPEYPEARPKIRQNPEIRKSGDEIKRNEIKSAGGFEIRESGGYKMGEPGYGFVESSFENHRQVAAAGEEIRKSGVGGKSGSKLNPTKLGLVEKADPVFESDSFDEMVATMDFDKIKKKSPEKIPLRSSSASESETGSSKKSVGIGRGRGLLRRRPKDEPVAILNPMLKSIAMIANSVKSDESEEDPHKNFNRDEIPTDFLTFLAEKKAEKISAADVFTTKTENKSESDEVITKAAACRKTLMDVLKQRSTVKSDQNPIKHPENPGKSGKSSNKSDLDKSTSDTEDPLIEMSCKVSKTGDGSTSISNPFVVVHHDPNGRKIKPVSRLRDLSGLHMLLDRRLVGELDFEYPKHEIQKGKLSKNSSIFFRIIPANC
jgi:hypothetical protein